MRNVYLPFALASAVSLAAVLAFAQPPAEPKARPSAGKAAAAKPAAGKGATGAAGAKAAAAKKQPSQEVPAVKPKRWDGKTVASSDPRVRYVEVSAWPKERPLLLIRYPWKVHSRPSIEVRYLADDERDTAEIRPLGFVAQMKADVAMAMYRCLDLSEDRQIRKTFQDKDGTIEVVGRKNELGNVVAEAIILPKEGAAEAAARVVYFPLDPWGADEESLRLELPVEHFSKPGRVRVWLFREGSVVWWQTVAWPGRK